MLLNIKTTSSPPALPTQDMSAASTGNNPPSTHSVFHSMPPFLHNLLHLLPLPMETGALALQSRWREWAQRPHGHQVLPSLHSLTFRCWATQGGWRIRVGGNPCHDTHPSSSVWVSQAVGWRAPTVEPQVGIWISIQLPGATQRRTKRSLYKEDAQQGAAATMGVFCFNWTLWTICAQLWVKPGTGNLSLSSLNLIMEWLISMFIWIK